MAQNSYKAMVIRRGAECENVYGADPERVLRSALKKLHTQMLTTPPVRVDLYEQKSKISGNKASWTLVRTVHYANEAG